MHHAIGDLARPAASFSDQLPGFNNYGNTVLLNGVSGDRSLFTGYWHSQLRDSAGITPDFPDYMLFDFRTFH